MIMSTTTRPFSDHMYSPARENVVLVDCACLNNHTDSENGAGDHHGQTSSHSIRQPSVDQSAYPGTKFQDGGQQALLKTSSSTIVGLELPGVSRILVETADEY